MDIDHIFIGGAVEQAQVVPAALVRSNFPNGLPSIVFHNYGYRWERFGKAR